MERKLVSVQQISNLEPITNADFIEKAVVMGWSVVVKKGEFQIGDLCAFFEIDSVLPDVPWAEFMRKSNFRVKTQKMRGVLSQGLALPLATFNLNPVNIGDEITEFLGVTKFERPSNMNDMGFMPFPSFIPKTDEIRLQSALSVLDELKGKDLEITLKLDGTSATYAKLDGELYVCSRNNRLEPSNNVYWQMVDKYNLQNLPDGYAIQGEICGPKIQGNKLCLASPDLFVFNVYDIKIGKYIYTTPLLLDFDMKTVPVLHYGKFDPDNLNLDYLLKYAEGKYQGTNNQREGIVIRTTDNSYSPTLKGRLSVKVISNKFLLSGGDE